MVKNWGESGIFCFIDLILDESSQNTQAQVHVNIVIPTGFLYCVFAFSIESC